MPTFYWTAFAFVRFTLALIAGIVGASRVWPDFAGWLAIFGIALGTYLLAWLGLPKEFRRIYRTAFGAFALSTITLGGAALLKEITDKYNEELLPCYGAARLWVDSITDPIKTRKSIAVGIGTANHAPIRRRYDVGMIQT